MTARSDPQTHRARPRREAGSPPPLPGLLPRIRQVSCAIGSIRNSTLSSSDLFSWGDLPEEMGGAYMTSMLGLHERCQTQVIWLVEVRTVFQ